MNEHSSDDQFKIDQSKNEQSKNESNQTVKEQLTEATELQSSNENLVDCSDANKVVNNKSKRKKKNKNKVNSSAEQQLTDKANGQLVDQSKNNQNIKIDDIQIDQENQTSQLVQDIQSDQKMSVNVNIDDKTIDHADTIQIDSTVLTDNTENKTENNLNELIISDKKIQQKVEETNEKKLEKNKTTCEEHSKHLDHQTELENEQNKHQSNGKQNGKSDENGKSIEANKRIPELLLTENNLTSNSTISTKLLIGGILLFKFFSYFIIKFIGLFHPTKRCKLPPINEPLLLLRAEEITEKVKSGELKCEQLIRAYINRIEQVQPKLNAVVDNCFDEAINKAKEIDEQLKVPELAVELKKLPLLGVPFTCKDSIAVKGLFWTAGVKIRKGIKADVDATVIRNLRSAGAIPLALTNTPELVLWCDSENKLYGRTNNPYDLSRIVGGSSGGEGCLISAAGSLFGVCSDVAGSIRIPAMFNGVFGHKTIKKYVPVDSMFPSPPPTYDKFVCYGPIARYASDLPILLRSMGGSLTDELNLDEPVDLKKIKIYYMEHDGGNPFVSFVDQRILNTMHKAIKYFKDEFGIETEKINIKKFKYAIPFFATACVKGQMKIEDFVSRTGKVNVYWELFKSLFGKSDITRPILIQIINQNSPYCDPNSESYKKLIKILEELKPKVHDLLGDNAVLFMPTWPTVAPKHQTTILRGFDASFTAIMNALEVPATHCPMGLTKEEGLPLGFTVAAAPGRDRISIAFAKEIEKKFKGWVPPPASSISSQDSNQ